ncbi:hypothetical protein DMN91_013002 [Ooceraea biroi]|uniref:THAP-type domain-containing protein n=1 Tax=Ooceraea biroi TaxID=2015173 RepID=A0A3L8D3R5_OOCBI|nr:THAP domain-containing protein 2-like isoform X1 [Ooceraea biroi]RLU15115.1 hypothetical protein DMN91_013002 [Ooceraea biroi]
MGYCIVSGCSNRSSNKRKNWEQLEKENNHNKFSFHLFPKDPDKCNKWLEALGLKNWYPCKTAAVCSAHFKEEDYEPNLALKRLKKDAVPYLPTKEALGKTESIIQHKAPIEKSLATVKVGTGNKEILISTDEIANTHDITLQNASNTVHRPTSILPERISNSSSNAPLEKTYMKDLQLLRRKLYDTTYSERKAKKEVYRLRITLKELKKRDLIPMNNCDFLQLLSDCIKELLKCELRKHKCLPVYLKIN